MMLGEDSTQAATGHGIDDPLRSDNIQILRDDKSRDQSSARHGAAS